MAALFKLTQQLQTQTRWRKDRGRDTLIDDIVAPAVDWSSGAPRELPDGLLYIALQVLVISNTRIQTADLESILSQTPRLQKLDASRCGLTHVPPANVLEKLTRLSIIFFHRNLLTKWVDVERALTTPNLKWLTMFENPIASQPEFREVVLQHAPMILAVDYWAVSDGERIAKWSCWKQLASTRAAMPTASSQNTFRVREVRKTNSIFTSLKTSATRNSVMSNMKDVVGKNLLMGSRFVPTSLNSVIIAAFDHPKKVHKNAHILLQDTDRQIEAVHKRSRTCSAALAIQTAWKTYHARCSIEDDHEQRMTVVVKIQRQARAWLWKKRTGAYLRSYLNDIDELDLLLSAKEMLSLKAMKRIEDMCRRWVKRRNDKQMTRGAATMISRIARGCMIRKAFLRQSLELDVYHQIHFPESLAWEFLVLLNVARHKCRLPPLPRDHKFAPSSLIAIRVPEATDVPHRNAFATRLISMRNAFLLRPLRSNRERRHLWDGPAHRLVDQSSSEKIQRAFLTVSRRCIHVDNHCRRAFLWSCAPGSHPIDRKSTSTSFRRKLYAAHAKDFSDLYALGPSIGEGTYGLVFECTKRSTRDQTTFCTKLVEHQGTWWDALAASRGLCWKIIARELDFLRSLHHPNIVNIFDLFIGDSFVYIVTERLECNLAAACAATREATRRPLLGHVVGSVAAQMLSPLNLLHEHKVAHRDVKLDNFCVDTVNLRGRFRIVLVDLHSAQRAEENVFFKEPMCAQREYWAPEVAAKAYSHAADVWALGVTLWHMWTSSFPFLSLKDALTLELLQVARMEDDFYELVEVLLKKDPSERYSAAEAANHLFIRQSLDKAALYGKQRHDQWHSQCHGPAAVLASTAAPQASDAFDRDMSVPADDEFSAARDPDSVAVRAIELDAFDENGDDPVCIVRSRRYDKLRSGDERFAQGEKVALSLDEAVASVAQEVDGSSESTSYIWWSRKMCEQMNWESDFNSPAIPRAPSKRAIYASRLRNSVALAQQTLIAAVPCQGDDVLLEPIGVEHVHRFLQRRGSQGDDTKRLLTELEDYHSRLLRRVGQPLRVVDFIVLRIASPNGKILVQVSVKASTGAKVETTSPRLPTMISQESGSGVKGLLRDVRQLVETEMGLGPDTFDVHTQGGVATSDVVQPNTDCLPPIDSFLALGVGDLCRRQFFDANVNSNLGTSRLSAMGLPDDKSFITGKVDGTRVAWEWWDKERCISEGLPVDTLAEMPAEFEGYQGLDRKHLGRHELPKLLSEHGVDVEYFGVGEAKKMRQLIAEVQMGETQLYEKYGQRGLRRYVEVLVVKVYNALGACLVSAKEYVNDDGQFNVDYSLPKVSLRSFEDKIWAVRRTLRELGLPLAMATASFGARRREEVDDPAFPGIISVYLEQDVQVRLQSVDINSLVHDDLGASSWFERSEPSKSIEDEDVNLQLRELLEGPERAWPVIPSDNTSALRLFMLEARRLGSRPHRANKKSNGPVVVRAAQADDSSGRTRQNYGPKLKDLTVYRDATWLNDRMLCCDCGSVAVTEELISLLLRFPGLKGDAPLVKVIPFVVEKHAREVAAAVCIQAAFRAHRQRMQLCSGLRFALVVRRCAICIQSFWRWALVKRRLHLLQGALKTIQRVKSTSLFIEERVLTALNLINGINRYAPTLCECGLAFAYSEKADGIALVREDLRGENQAGWQKAARKKATGSINDYVAQCEKECKARKIHRDGGLPTWLRNALDIQTTGPDDPALRKVNGLQGLLLEGLVQQPQESDVVTVHMPSLQHAGLVSQSGEGMMSPALVASGGTFRFVELKFHSVQQAQRRAAMLYLCTYSAMHRVAVPLIPKQNLHMVDVCDAALALWDIYGLVWPQGDRTALYQLRQKNPRMFSEAVHFSGRESWRTVSGLAWLSSETKWDNASNRLVTTPEGGKPREVEVKRPSYPELLSLPSSPAHGRQASRRPSGQPPLPPITPRQYHSQAQSPDLENGRASTPRAAAGSGLMGAKVQALLRASPVSPSPRGYR